MANSSRSGKAPPKSRRGKAISAKELPSMLRTVNLNAAGIDVGATQHYVAIPEGRDAVRVRCFGTFTSDLAALADWLIACGVTTVAMESTGVYWIPVFELLEERGLEVRLVEPGRLKSVPGRKTDVLDCQWIQQLHTYGLLQGSFRPEDDVCVLRSYMRQRATLVRYAGQHVLHMQKALMQMNVQLHHVIADITGATGMRIIDAILNGVRDPSELAKLRSDRCKHGEETIALALRGNWREEHLFALKQAVELYRFYHQEIAQLDGRIENCLKTFENRSAGQQAPPPRRPKAGSNAPEFDVRKLMLQMTGVDLATIHGLNGYSAMELISEIGLDMRRWPTEKHFASWLCLCPGNKKTGGRTISGRTRRNANRAATVLRMAAQSVARSHCALGDYYRRMRARLGGPKAITATAHKIAKIVYNMLRYGKPYVDRGANYYEQQYRQRTLKNLARRAAQFGFTLATAKPAQAAPGN